MWRTLRVELNMRVSEHVPVLPRLKNADLLIPAHHNFRIRALRVGVAGEKDRAVSHLGAGGGVCEKASGGGAPAGDGGEG